MSSVFSYDQDHDNITLLEDDYKILVADDVLVGILDHAYSDIQNEIIGHLGGTVDVSSGVVHATHFIAGRRVPCTNHPASVENNPEDQHAANQRFGDEGVQYVGWYHSHPRLDPTPSDKDIMMQSELQKQLPYCVGMICSPFGKFGQVRIAIPMLIERRLCVPTPFNQREILHTDRAILEEAKELKATRKKSLSEAGSTGEAMLVDDHFNSFVSELIHHHLMPAGIGLAQDMRTIELEIERTKQQISDQLLAIAQSNYVSESVEEFAQTLLAQASVFATAQNMLPSSTIAEIINVKPGQPSSPRYEDADIQLLGGIDV